MSTIDEKRLLLLAIDTLKREACYASSTDEAIDLAERLRSLNQCLVDLNWSEINRRK